MKATLEYWDRDEGIIYSKLISHIEIEGENQIILFEKFYKLNNSLRYCNGSYYKFQDKEMEKAYQEWMDSDDYKAKAFRLFYNGNFVD